MSKLSFQAKVYNVLKAASGPVSVEDLLKIEGLRPYKLSAYVLYAKGAFGAVIKPIKDGKRVVAYEMTDAGNGIPVKTPVAKVVKTPKVKTAKTVAPVLAKSDLVPDRIVGNKQVVDVLDEMEIDVASFEDRQFAEDYVRSL